MKRLASFLQSSVASILILIIVLSGCSNWYIVVAPTTFVNLSTEPTSPGNLELYHNWTRLQTPVYPPVRLQGGLMSDDPLNKGVLFFDSYPNRDSNFNHLNILGYLA